jgi:hypothetical protein
MGSTSKESPIGEIRRGSTVQGHARASAFNTGAKDGIVVTWARWRKLDHMGSTLKFPTFSLLVTATSSAWVLKEFPQSTKESPIGEIRRGSTVQGHARASAFNTGAKGWNVTGWRDPFYLLLPQLDTLLDKSEPHYYAILGPRCCSLRVPTEHQGKSNW